MRAELRILQSEIDWPRLGYGRGAAVFWPCRRGCDHCCRHLAGLPVVTPPEEELLREGIAALDEAARAGVAERFRALGAAPERPVVCPLLDPATGACLVYEQRPVACRTYSFMSSGTRGCIAGRLRRRWRGVGCGMWCGGTRRGWRGGWRGGGRFEHYNFLDKLFCR